MSLHQANTSGSENSNWTLTSCLHAQTCLKLIPVHYWVQVAGYCLATAQVFKLYYFCVQLFIDNGENQLLHINFNSCVSVEPVWLEA